MGTFVATTGDRRQAWSAFDSGDMPTAVRHMRNALTTGIRTSGYCDRIGTQQILTDLTVVLYKADKREMALRLETILWAAERRYRHEEHQSTDYASEAARRWASQLLEPTCDPDVAQHYARYKKEIDDHLNQFWRPSK
jgi:hypothetical protein